MLKKILEHNNRFLSERKKLGFCDKSISANAKQEVMIFTCMDTRLVELVEKSMGFERGDIKVLKNAGNCIRENCDEIIRCISLGAIMMGLKEVFVVGHKDCGMKKLTVEDIRAKMINRGITEEAINSIDNLAEWSGILKDETENVIKTVSKIRESQFVPKDVKVHGLTIDPYSGELEVIINGDEIDKLAK
ncbi:beta-class carbonic anhydrase [Wukongibacter sp. M2B1]|uniref:beta-class carbonic anhydrase n=1 Tax=Wukongibacter sp. M2B1 TaxID=3088895 RepID=UPI003D78DF19